MKCREIREKILERIDGNGSVAKDAMLSEHIAACDLCRRFYVDAVLDRRLSRTLREMPVPEPAPGFAEKTVQYAVAADRVRRRQSFFVGVSAAAVLLIIVGISLVMGILDPAIQQAEVIIPVGGEKTVHIMIEAAAARTKAKLDIAIAGDVILKGYSGRKQLQWLADIRQGKNYLALPLYLQDMAGGQVNVKYAYDNTESEVFINVRAAKPGLTQT